MRAAVRCLLLGPAAALLVGCPSPTCDSPAPCQDSLIVGLPAAGAGDYQLSLSLDGTPQSCDITLDGAGNGSKTCSSEQVDVGTLDGAIWVYVYGTPTEVSLRLEMGDRVVFERDLSPRYRELSQDSQNCVSCLQAELDYTDA
ncbi:MAG: hypothetical protein KC766_17370 [Myxococcales bacterium]|nr:hypothetical protein [Myxococcales bacterium]